MFLLRVRQPFHQAILVNILDTATAFTRVEKRLVRSTLPSTYSTGIGIGRGIIAQGFYSRSRRFSHGIRLRRGRPSWLDSTRKFGAVRKPIFHDSRDEVDLESRPINNNDKLTLELVSLAQRAPFSGLDHGTIILMHVAKVVRKAGM